MAPKDDPELKQLREELEGLINKCKEAQNSKADVKLGEVCSEMPDVPKCRIGMKKLLKGHINKVNSVHYSGDSRHAVSGSLDGKLIIWDTWSGNKVQVVPLRSAWVMSVAFSQSGNFVACGGMDNQCTVYDLNNRDSTGVAKMTRELLGYEGFLSSCRFINDSTLITGSGDMKVCVWDLETSKKTQEFSAHCGDVVSISLSPDLNNYVTGSVDRTCRLWDIRTSECLQTFYGHQGDVNCVCYHPSGQAFVTASEDKTARMYDIRSDQEIGSYSATDGNPGFTSCGLSLSGRYMFCGSEEKHIHIWDTLKMQYNSYLSGHDNRVTSLSVAPNGMSVVSSSWDNNLRVWV